MKSVELVAVEAVALVVGGFLVDELVGVLAVIEVVAGLVEIVQ